MDSLQALFFFFQAEDGIRDVAVTGVQTCALPISSLNTIERIGRPEAAEEFVLTTLRNKDKVFGFGHRVYKTYDPRALILKDYARRLAEISGDDTDYRIATAIEDTVVRQLASKHIYPNVDFYAGLVFRGLGIPP